METSVPGVILWLAISLVATKLGCRFAVKAGQPAAPRTFLSQVTFGHRRFVNNSSSIALMDEVRGSR
jgi:hypothetical protein